MTYTEFVNAVREGGWTDSGDAQHKGIRNLWEQLFPEHAMIETLEQDVERLRDMIIG